MLQQVQVFEVPHHLVSLPFIKQVIESKRSSDFTIEDVSIRMLEHLHKGIPERFHRSQIQCIVVLYAISTFSKISPSVAFSTPANILAKVVLPIPFEPNAVTISSW